MDRFKATKVAGLLGIGGNIFLLIIKAYIGFISKSQAMISDSVNSAADIFASLMTFIGNKIASEPKDADHNFGHGKAEYIFSLFISISMIIASIKLIFNSISSLIHYNSFEFSWILVIVCVVTIIVKFILFIYTKFLANIHKNILLESSYQDHRNDCIVTSFTLISILFSLINIYWVDGIVGTAISLWICFSGIKIFIESYNVLMDICIDSDTQNKILNLAKEFKDIKSVDNISSTPIGYKYLIVLTIMVDGNMSTFKRHKLADDLEDKILELDRIENVIVHVEPI